SAKFPYLKKGEYDIWAMKMQNFISSSDLLCWNIVLKGNSAKSMTTDNDGNLKIRPPVTAKEHQQVQGEEKEGLDKGYDKMQKILTQMNTLKIKPNPEDVNMKFLRGLPPSWSGIALILKTKGGLEYISFDDLYNKLKFLEIDTKGYSSSSSTLSNAALGSSKSKCSVADDVIYYFFENHEIDQHLVYEDLDQMNKEDFEEYDLKYQMAMLSIQIPHRLLVHKQSFSLSGFGFIQVLLNGDSPTPTRVVVSVVQAIDPTTADQRLAKKNKLKARGTLLMALLDKHQLKFNIHKDAKSLMKAIEKSTNESVNDVPSVSAASTKPPASILPIMDNLSDTVIYSFFTSQSNSPQLDNDELKQIDANDLEEMDLKWSPRDTRNKDTQRRNVPVETSTSNALVSRCDGVSSYDWSFQANDELTNYALMAFTSLSSSSSDNDVAPCTKACSKAYATLQSHYEKLTNDLRKSQFDVLSYKTSLESVEARLVIYQQNENVFKEDIKLLKLDVMLRDNALVELRKKFEKAKKESDNLKHTLKNFRLLQKNLSKLLESQITDKTGLGYDNQVFNSTVFDYEELNSSESDVSVPTSPVHDRYKSGEEDEFKGEPMPTQKAPSFVQNSKHVKTPRTAVKLAEHPTQAENLRKDILTLRGHKHSWNRKACFGCKSLNHLIKDCDFYATKMVQNPIWNYAMRVNHHNSARMTHPHSKKHVVPTTVLTRHMNENISYLSDFEEINGGYVAFGGNLKGSKITSKDTECVVLSSDFKLPNKNHVLLRVPRDNNMYNVDLKNIVPSGDLTCLFAKATLDESNLWHRRLGHINFKTMNKLVKGIKREFSVATTPQQNRVAKRKNRTLIKAVRTMLADSLLPIPFWAKAIITACYVQNRVLVTKPHNKTPYELLLGRTPSIGFMRPFGCPVTTLNTLDPLGKFNGKANEGFLIGYSVNNKAFRVFDSSTRIVQETLHINFLENQPNVAASGPIWLFDIDTLTQSMNYQPVVARNQPNSSTDPQNTDADAAFDDKENESEVHVSPSSSDKPKKHDEKAKREAKGTSLVDLSTRFKDFSDEFEEFSVNNIDGVNAASASVTTVGPNSTNNTNTFNTAGPSDNAVSPTFEIDDEEDVGAAADFSNLETTPKTRSMTRMVKEQGGLNQLNDEDFHTYLPKGKRAIGSKWVFRNKKDERGIVIRNKARLPLGFGDPDYPDKGYKVVKALYGLHQAPRAWYLKGKPHLGLWYPKDSPFNLVSYSDSDYVGTSLDRKFTTGGCQFLGCRLIYWQCKKQTVVTTSSTEAEYVAAASCYAQYQVDEKDGIEVTDVDLQLLLSGGCIQTGGKITELDADEDVTLEDVDAEFKIDANIHGRMAESQAKVYNLDLQHSKKVLSMQDTDEAKPSEVEEVIEVVTAAKLMTKVVTTTAPITTAAQVPKLSALKKRRGVVIQDPEEIVAALVIIHTEDEAFSRQLEADMNININWNDARKNMMIYLKNMVGFKIDFFKEKKEKEIDEEGSKRKGENLEQDIAKKQRMDEDAEELKRHLQIIANDDDDDVYTEATPLASKNFNRENMETPLTLVKERFKSTEPKTFSDDFLVNTLKIMFKKPNVEANVWRDQKGRYGGLVMGIESIESVEMDELNASAMEVEGGCIQTGGKITELDADEDVTLEDVDDEVEDTDEAEPSDVEEVIEVVTAAKLMTKVVTTTAPITTAAQVPKPSALRKRRGVVIQDPEETVAALVIIHTEVKLKDKGKGILIEEPKPLKKQAQIKQDEAFARQLEADMNININWNDVMEQARKNMMIYLKNMVGFKMDFFKEKKEKEIDEEGSKRKGENLEQDIAKKQRIDKEAKELKRHLHIIANDDDDMYTKATPLASKRKLGKSFDTDFLLNTLKIMFKKPNVEANVWRDQNGRYGLPKVKS
nr:putative ribonuclease H-like domain-containing protein [Tanacetum cinerariifolium]